MTTSQNPYSNKQVNLDDLTSLGNISLKPLHPKYPTIAVIHALTFQLILVAIFSVIYVRTDLSNLFWLLMVAEVSLSLSVSYIGAKRCGYALREHDVISKKGLWQQKTTAVSFNRIQHIDISNDPIERRYNTATIKLFTAGGSSADLSISGLPHNIAQSIRQKVLDRISHETQTAQHELAPEINKNISSKGLTETNQNEQQLNNPKALGNDNEQQ